MHYCVYPFYRTGNIFRIAHITLTKLVLSLHLTKIEEFRLVALFHQGGHNNTSQIASRPCYQHSQPVLPRPVAGSSTALTRAAASGEVKSPTVSTVGRAMLRR